MNGFICLIKMRVTLSPCDCHTHAERLCRMGNSSGDQDRRAMKYWEIIARNLKKRGWSLRWVSAVDSEGRTIWIADAHRGDGKRFVVRADEKLTAFVELKIGDSG